MEHPYLEISDLIPLDVCSSTLRVCAAVLSLFNKVFVATDGMAEVGLFLSSVSHSSAFGLGLLL